MNHTRELKVIAWRVYIYNCVGKFATDSTGKIINGLLRIKLHTSVEVTCACMFAVSIDLVGHSTP